MHHTTASYTVLKQAFSIGANKAIFSTLLQRFHTKNHSMQKECYKPLIKVCGINDLEFLKESVNMLIC